MLFMTVQFFFSLLAPIVMIAIVVLGLAMQHVYDLAIENWWKKEFKQKTIMSESVPRTHIQIHTMHINSGQSDYPPGCFDAIRLFFWHHIDMLIKIRIKHLSATVHHSCFSLAGFARARVHVCIFVCNFRCCCCQSDSAVYQRYIEHCLPFAQSTLAKCRKFLFFRCTICKYNVEKNDERTNPHEHNHYYDEIEDDEERDRRRRRRKKLLQTKRNRIMRRALS